MTTVARTICWAVGLAAVLGNAGAAARDVYVAPDGSPQGDGSRQRPLDLATALSSAEHVKPGDTAWLGAGTYHGPFDKPAQPSGTAAEPIIYRAEPGGRVTLTAGVEDRHVLGIAGPEHVWFWGFEVTVPGKPELGHYGGGVSLRGGRQIKLINLVIHDCPNRTGIGGSNLGSEFYGCIIYRNGRWADCLAHGTYTQNRPEDVGGDLEALPWKVHRDCAIFNNFGWGVHSYATNPKLANLLFEGVVAYGNGLVQGATKPAPNFLAGGMKFDDNVVLRQCLTYYPDQGNFKRGADLGYEGENGRLVVEESHFIGGRDAVWIRKWREATLRGCTFFTANGRAIHLIPPGAYDAGNYQFAENTYYKPGPAPFGFGDRTFDTLDAWQKATGLDEDSRLIEGRPLEPWVFVRPNRYEPDRAFLVVYNWPKTATVSIGPERLGGLKSGQEYAIVSVEDVWGPPVWRGRLGGEPIELPLVGSYAPEFACYLAVEASGDKRASATEASKTALTTR